MARVLLCHPCANDYQINYYSLNRERKRAQGRERLTDPKAYKRRRLQRHRLTIEDFEEMFAAQDGRCNNCRVPLELYARTTHVDHDHKSGMVRSILCHNCNLLIGHSLEDPARLRAAIEYLEHPERWWGNRQVQ